MAGVGIQMSPSATLDIGYRYLNAGATTRSITSQTGRADQATQRRRRKSASASATWRIDAAGPLFRRFT